MPRTLRELRADLRRPGFAIDHQTGSHQVWKHPFLPGVGANVAGQDGADAKAYQESEVCKGDPSSSWDQREAATVNEKLQYSMLVEWSSEDEAYLVSLPEWEQRVFGPVTRGDSYEEAVRNGYDALTALIESATRHSEPLPEPRRFARA